jgi:hypothetical protein
MSDSNNARKPAPSSSSEAPAERSTALRSALATTALFGAVIGFGILLNSHYSIERWLFWKYAKVTLCAVFWLISCVVAGAAIVERLTPGLEIRERLIQSVACGVFAFYILHFLGGILGLFGPTWSIALPSVMLVLGAVASRPQLREILQNRRLLPKLSLGGDAYWQVPVFVFGVLCVGWIYISILSPRNIAFDALWYHLGLGQGWAADGAILRSQEGWLYEGLPNMAAVLYSWGFLLPGFDLFETTALAAHIELLLFLVTLASIPVLTEWLLPGTRASLAWVAAFLFPSVFIYDAGLHTGNDHIAAFWAIPIFLALRRAWTRLDWRNMTLLALCAAGALMTKYQAISLVVGPVLFVLGRLAYLAAKRRDDASWLVGTLVALVAGIAFTSPLWAKNWIWYGDPFFPALHKYLEVRPWNEDMPALMEANLKLQVRRPRGPLGERLIETIWNGIRFSFTSFTHGRFHGKLPYFGSLFTLSALWLPFLRNTKRTWALFLATQLGVFAWYNFSHVERYLQLLVPWMAAVVVAALVLAWRLGWFARVPLVALVLLQVVWGGDAPFIRSHAMARELPMVHSARLIESGYKRNWKLRERVFDPLQRIGEALPPQSTVALHELNPRLGLSARVITDMPRLQTLIRYGLMGSAQEFYDLYRELGVTHIVWRDKHSYGFDTLAGDLRFFDFVTNGVTRKSKAGGWVYGPMPSQRPEVDSSDVVLYAGCESTFQPGLFRLRDMNVLPGKKNVKGFEPLPDDEPGMKEAIERVSFVVHGKKCKNERPPVANDFILVANRKGEDLWVRKW